ncbi:hypothetical protein CDCA_CDCA10G3089 [Cyanidium caldarium]|uniref:RING-type domain-containing protein n=1 Tax=Cyanidium caldarium TaxID=2771 RepID=A0AAV9IY84_CYACA|nr:hypothetical protein CDCA_CDCA10G3089 [Cyanidium caldarium]
MGCVLSQPSLIGAAGHRPDDARGARGVGRQRRSRCVNGARRNMKTATTTTASAHSSLDKEEPEATRAAHRPDRDAVQDVERHFLEACVRDDVSTVTALLEATTLSEPKTNAVRSGRRRRHHDGCHAAVTGAALFAVDVNRTVDGTFPLVEASEHGSVRVVVRLLEAGALPYLVRERDGKTALAAAVAANQPRTVRALLRGGAGRYPRMDARRDDSESVLVHSVRRNYEAIVVQLLANRVGDAQALRVAVECNHRALMERLAEQPREMVNVAARTEAFYAAVRCGFTSLAAQLLHYGATPDVERALHLACAHGAGRGMLAFLKSRGASVNAFVVDDGEAMAVTERWRLPQGETALCADPTLMDPVPVADTIRDEQTPLMRAAVRGHDETVRCLLDLGADPNVRAAATGMTALHWAARTGQADAVDALLHPPSPESRVEVEARNAADETPLEMALSRAVLARTDAEEERYARVIDRLLAEGACLTGAAQRPGTARTVGAVARVLQAYRSGDESVLVRACECASQHAVARLLRRADRDHTSEVAAVIKADDKRSRHDTAITTTTLHPTDWLFPVQVDRARGRDGRTPLMAAARRGHLGIVRLLLEHGAAASVEARNHRGATAVIEAALCPAPSAGAVVHLLVEEAGAAVSARDAAGWTALHAAAWSGNVGAAREFIRCASAVAVDDDDDDDDGNEHEQEGSAVEVPLRLALLREHYAVARVLLLAGAQWARAGADDLLSAEQAVQRLAASATIAPNGATPEEDLMRGVLVPGAADAHPLSLAVRLRHLTAVQEVLYLRRVPPLVFEAACRSAAASALSESAAILLELAEADATRLETSTGWTVLAVAAAAGRLDVVQRELEAHRPRNASDSTAAVTEYVSRVLHPPDTTALSVAVGAGHEAIAVEMVASGAANCTALYGALRVAQKKRHEDEDANAGRCWRRLMQLLDEAIDADTSTAALAQAITRYRTDSGGCARPPKTAAGTDSSSPRLPPRSLGTCPVCLEAFTGDGPMRPMLGGACGHSLCARCNQRVEVCPLCRGKWYRRAVLNVELATLATAWSTARPR